MKYLVKTKLYLATAIMHILSLGFFFLASLPWYFPSLVAQKSTFEGLGVFSIVSHVLIGFALFISNWFIHISGFGYFNSIDNFYAPAVCGATRQLLPGVLMRVNEGSAYKLIWAAWCMTYIVGTALMITRVCWIKSNMAGKEMDAAVVKSSEREARKAAKMTQAAQRKVDNTKISEKSTTASLASDYKSSGTVVDSPV